VCRSAGKPVGQLIGSAQDGAAAAARGFQILAYADVWVFENALRDGLAVLREAATAPRSG
jgi:hypothetical protein